MISSVTNPAVRRVRRLRKPLWRERQQRFIVEGHRAVETGLDAGAAFDDIFLTPRAEAARTAVVERARAAGVNVTVVSPAIMAHWTSAATAPDVLAVAPIRRVSRVEAPAVVLCGVHDPGVAGGIMATAAAVGMRAIVQGPATTDLYDQKVVRAAQGAHLALPVLRGVALDACLAQLGGRVVVAAEKGVAPWDAVLPPDLVLVIDGDDVCSVDAERVCVPAEGHLPALSARAAVVLYEWVRQSGAASR